MSGQPITYISTRGGIAPVSFSEAVMMGLARDGGLLLPASIPDVRDRLGAWSGLAYPELAAAVMQPFTDLAPEALRALINRSYATFDHPDVAPVVPVGDIFVAELFHGPTLAFKDFALQFLGNLFAHILERDGGELNLVGATSGDTGSAAIHGVRGREHIRIFIMHPHGRVSRSQLLQMTAVLDDNVHNIAIDGTFDDCQHIAKALFNDLALRDRYRLGSVNSINWSRVLAQVVYYFHATFCVLARTGADAVQVAVPTGNFGDIFAGYLAVRMGAPIKRLILATNENDILSRFFNTGEYRVGSVHATLSPSMDIQVASNFERYLYYRVGESPERLRPLMRGFAETGALRLGDDDGGDPLFAAGVGDTAATLATIARCYRDHDYLLDPHTAVGVHVAQRYASASMPTICLATAHPAKFGDAITQAVGRDVAHHPTLDALAGAKTRMDVLPASVEAVRAFLAERIKVS